MTGVDEVLPALGQVVTVILTQSAEPFGSGELGTFVSQWVEVLAWDNTWSLLGQYGRGELTS